VVLAFGVTFFGAVFAAMAASLFEERGGEGGRPVEGARCDDSGKARFSRGFLNITKSFHDIARVARIDVVCGGGVGGMEGACIAE
jgi:hypothetical protein